MTMTILRAASTSTSAAFASSETVNAMDELLGTRTQPERWSRSRSLCAEVGTGRAVFFRLPFPRSGSLPPLRFESDTIISSALRRLTVRGSKPDSNALHRRINAEEQYQDHSVSLRYS